MKSDGFNVCCLVIVHGCCLQPSPEVVKDFFLPSLYHLLWTQEGTTHPWYSFGTLRHNFGASSPGIPKKRRCVMGHPYSLSHPFTVFFQPLLTGITTLLSTQCMRLLKSKAEFQNQLLSVVICRNYPHCNSLNPHTRHVGAERASSMFCHHVDPCWEGIPCAVETKSACIVNMAPSCWLGLNVKTPFTQPMLGRWSFPSFMHFLFVYWIRVVGVSKSKNRQLMCEKTVQFCLTFNYTHRTITGHWEYSSNTCSSTYTQYYTSKDEGLFKDMQTVMYMHVCMTCARCKTHSGCASSSTHTQINNVPYSQREAS